MFGERHSWKRWLALVLVMATMGSLFVGLTPTLAQAAPELEIYGMTTEYMEDPIGLGRQDLAFSWKLRKGDERGVRQDTYRISVFDGDETVWDSGVVTSDDASGIPYGGETLAAGRAYRWRVAVTDNRGGSASGEATFGMGLFTEADWNGAQWISSTGGTSTVGGADPGRYTVEVDFTLETGSFGLMLGADTSNFFMYQINAVQDGTYIYVRPHSWTGGGASLLGEANTGIPVEGFLGREHSLRLEIDHGTLTGYLDGTPVTYDGQGTTLTYNAIRELAGVGLRAYYNPNNTDKDAVKINKLVLRNSLGRPVYYDDFTGANSMDNGTVEDGQLVVRPVGQRATEWRVWQRPADSQIYSAQADVQIETCAAGFVFGAQDGSHFYMWQLNTLNYPSASAPAAEKLTYLRPHLWNGGPTEYGQDVNVNDIVSKEEMESAPATLRVDVNNGTLTSYLNGVQVDQRTSSQRYGIGSVGTRQSKDTDSVESETGYFDNIMLRDTGGRVVLFDDFEDEVNYYEGAGASLVDGRLRADGSAGREVFLRAGAAPAPQGASRVPLLRKDFTTENKEIARAVVYASALGHYELQLNGGKVGEDYMAPGWTEYDTRVQYQAYDVTAQVAKNAVNSLGAMLAPGWYSGNISIMGNQIYGDTQALIANLVIEYADGERQTVVTDGTWTYSLDGPILETDMFDGERYDATRELGGGKYGWAVPDFDNSEWGTAGVLFDRAFGVRTGASGGNTIALTAQIGPTVKQIRELTPVSIRQVGGKYIVDMGQNFAGILTLSLTGRAGQTATIRYGEMLNDGPMGARGNDNPDGAGSLYTANLRSAKATDRYTFKSDQKETWTPTFTFHGFRYAEISGVSEAPALSDIRGLALASAMEETGAFDSSSALLNQIYQNAFWGQRSNFLSVPTDCPQRDERMGWGADTHVFAGTGLYNMNASMFYQKWLQDVRDGQAANGEYGNVAPNPHNFMNDIVWNAGGVIVPHTIWRMTGDTRVLTDSYDSMRRYMANRMAMDDIQACGYGDWLEPVDYSSDQNVIGTTYFAYQLSLMADIAEALGRGGEADTYRARFAQVNNTFHAQFVEADGTISNGIQSGYVLALGVGLTTPRTEPLFVQKLVDRIAADGGLMTVGFVSVNKLMPVLTRYGHSDIAYRLALATQYPSWGYSIAQGATTVWERWNSYTVANGFGPATMNSFNHYAFGSVAEWFYNGIAGINADPRAPGFQHVIIEPTLDDRLTYANARYESIRGEIFSGWTRGEDEIYTLEVRVPVNATATVVLPAAPGAVWESGLPVLNEDGAAQGEGITAVERGAAGTRVSVGSGLYRFTFDRTEEPEEPGEPGEPEEPGEPGEAQWIWDRLTDDRNAWTAFRKSFTLAEAPTGPVEAQIAVDAKYWLYINGELAVFEGGLKRGPNWNDTYADRVDIAPYLRAGENTIAVLAWHFGQGDWFSATNSGQAGLYFSAKAGDLRVVSDGSWKARRVEAYGFASKQPNYRIPESSLLFDARKELTNWQTADYDDETWAQAMTFGPAGAAPWNQLEDRPIPLFAYDDYVTFEETELTKTETMAGDTLREIPADDYVIETKFRILSAALGVIFGYRDSNNLNMWQIFTTSANDPNNGVPWLKPHIKSNGGWSVAGKFNIDSVSADEKFDHEYTLRLVVENKEVKGYVDGNLIYTGQAPNTRGGFGFRASSGERGSVDFIKVTSLDGSEIYYEDHFDGENNFNRGVIEDGRFVWTYTGGEEAVAMTGRPVTRYTAKMPTNFQFTPYLRVNAPEEGALIRMYTDKLNVDCVMAEYITKAGPQAYESLGWMNGDQLIFDVPAEVEVEALGYRRSGYAATFDGSFTSDDEFMNVLWRKARDTLYVTMRDGFMDCPDRERAQWWGDAVNEMQMAFYSLSPDAGLLVKKGINNVLGYVRDGVIPTVAPINTSWFELPAQSMAGIMSFYLYYEYTGDDSHFARAYPAAHTYLLTKFNMGTDGVVQHRGGSWDWSDWGSHSDQKLITNAWYYVALDRTLKMAERLGIDMEADATVQALRARKRSIEERFDTVFWNGGGFYRTPGVGVTDDRGNALAVFAGLASADKYPALRNVLMTVQNASPYMEKYVLEALYLMGYEDSAIERMKSRYADMVESHYSTLWEFWDPDSGTQNHAWTGGPLTMLSGYAAGVRPLTPGYETFTVAPQLGGIRNLSVVVPTVRGEIAASADTAPDGAAWVRTTVPAGTTAVVGVPLTGGRRATTVYYEGEAVWENGRDVPNGAGLTSTGSDDKFVYFTATSDITLTATRGEVQRLTVDLDDGQNMRLFVDDVEQVTPYQALYLKGESVQIRFESRYAGEYGVVAVDGADFGDETQMSYTVRMDRDHALLARTEWIGPVNLARGKVPVEADNAMTGAGDGSWGSNNLVDGERVSRAGKGGFTTREYFSQRDISENPHKITIDLGTVKNIDRVYLYPRSDAMTEQGGYPNYPQDFTIQVSVDGVSYTTVKTVTDEPAPTAAQGRGEYLFDVTPARYVRVVTTMLGLPAADEGRDSQGRVRNRLQLAEVEVYGRSDFTFDVAADKAARTVTVTGSGFEPGERVLLRTGYNYAPTAQENDYRAYVTADGEGRVNVTLPAEATADLPWLGGHRYHVSLGGVTKSAPIPATEVRAHSSARISVRIKGKAPLNLRVEALPEDAYTVTSSNAAIATADRVNGTWVVTGKRAGTALIAVRVSEEFGGATHIVTVAVS
ncbi:MAG: family 78 glycoside hydrolase catalytic domain [Oscillospiraceae bacterium]|jgi:hypothetical protein|nr:family 78 glycoside hydrolase catalytic domain [Oscillospiraceae bacterium]